jgi:hypothetical protein
VSVKGNLVIEIFDYILQVVALVVRVVEQLHCIDDSLQMVWRGFEVFLLDKGGCVDDFDVFSSEEANVSWLSELGES